MVKFHEGHGIMKLNEVSTFLAPVFQLLLRRIGKVILYTFPTSH